MLFALWVQAFGFAFGACPSSFSKSFPFGLVFTLALGFAFAFSFPLAFGDVLALSFSVRCWGDKGARLTFLEVAPSSMGSG